jgi:hypothetical protein
VQTVDASTLSADVGKFSLKDTRTFQVASRDAAGNLSAKTRALVVVPKTAKLTLAKAKSALTKRGLKAGKVSYVFSSLTKGRVVKATKSGLVLKGSAVPLTVSKGPRKTNSRATPIPGTTPPSPGTTYAPSPSPTSTTFPSATPSPAAPPAAEADPPEPDATTDAAAATADREGFSPSEVSSARRTAGLALLAALFGGAGAMVIRARRRVFAPVPKAESVDGPILFWDERLLRGIATAVRRVFR